MATDIYAYDPLGGYNVTPATQSGSGAYGAVPGNIQIPPNVYQQIGEIDPLLAEQTGTMNQTILSELMGELSPATKAAIQQNAASFGARSGMPLSQFAGNYGLTQLGLNVEKQQRQGIEDYLGMLRGTGATLTPQQLASEIASRNATMAAAPNPREAAMQQMSDWQNKFNQMAGGGGTTINPAGGRGTPLSTGGGGAYNTPAQAVGGLGPFNEYRGPGIQYDARGNYILPLGPTYGAGTSAPMIDNNGDEWVPFQGQYMNLTTGEMADQPPGYSAGRMYMGGLEGAPPEQRTPGLYMGPQQAYTDQDAELDAWLRSLGYDTSGMPLFQDIETGGIPTAPTTYDYGYPYGGGYEYGGYDWTLPDTAYNPVTDQSYYTGGTYGYDYGTAPEDTYYNPVTDTSNYDYGLGNLWDYGA